MNIIGKSWRDAASLIVLTKRNSEMLSRLERCGSINYDVLLQTRTDTASFANSVVFPGGVSETADGSEHWFKLISSYGYSKQDFQVFHQSGVAAPIFQDNPIQRHVQLRITAIRETFEELGLLICSKQRKDDRHGKWASFIDDIDVTYWQKRISKNPEDLLELCEQHKCYPDIWSLYYWNNWLTPASLPKRFDSVFFLTALEQKPNITSNCEVANVEWLPPDEVLSSDKIVQPPQLYELNRLSHVKDITELIEFASRLSKNANFWAYPVILKTKDGKIFLLPGDDLYPTSVDYNDNTIKFVDKTTLEFREGCQTLHRFEIIKDKKRFVIKNYKPDYLLNMGDTITTVPSKV